MPVCRGKSGLSELSAFHHSAYAFGVVVIAFGVVVLVEALSENESQSLIGICLESTDESFGDVISRLVSLAVYEFHEQFSL